MKNKSIVLKVIIVLLIIFLPPTIIGTVYRNLNPYVYGNPNKEFIHNGALWFYDNNNDFLSKYECLTEKCDYATPIIDDNTYNINYYQSSTSSNIGIINGIYTFILDGEKIFLYNINTGSNLQEYNAIKNYNVQINNNEYIIKNKDDLWGVLSFGNVLSNIIPFEYDFIGLLNNYDENNNVLKNDEYITLKKGKWQLINHDNSELSYPINYPIVDYNNNYIIGNDQGRFHIYDYRGTEFLTHSIITNYHLIGEYIAITVNNHIYIYNDLKSNYLKTINLSEITGELAFEIDDNNNLIVKNGENIIVEVKKND